MPGLTARSILLPLLMLMGLKFRLIAWRGFVVMLAPIRFTSRLGNALRTWLDTHEHTPLAAGI